jgi:hypothetical protein
MQRVIIQLSPTMSVEDISIYMDVGIRTIQKILAHFAQTGGVIVHNPAKPQLHQAITDYDIEVSAMISLSFRQLKPFSTCSPL